MRVFKTLIVVIVALLAGFVLPNLASNSKKVESKTEQTSLQETKETQKNEQSSSVLVVTAPITKETLNQAYPYVGSLYFSKKSSLASEVSGIIDAILVKEGDRVKKGTPLAILNSDLLRDEILSKEASLKQAKAQFAKIKKDYARYKALYESESISFKEYEDALFDMQAQEGNTESIANSLASLKTQKNKKTILAPYDGVILQKLLEEGEWVAVGASVFEVAEVTSLEATFEVSFEVLRSLKKGDKLEVLIAQKKYQATITAVIPLGDAKARTFPVKLSIDDPESELIEGLEVQASFNVGNEKGYFVIPRDSILPTSDGNVIVVAENGKARRIPIAIKAYRDYKAFVEPIGLDISDKNRVIVQGMERLKDGDFIRE